MNVVNLRLKNELEYVLAQNKIYQINTKGIFKYMNKIIFLRSEKLFASRYLTIHCSACDNKFHVDNHGTEFIPVYCAYCGYQFKSFTKPADDDRDWDIDNESYI